VVDVGGLLSVTNTAEGDALGTGCVHVYYSLIVRMTYGYKNFYSGAPKTCGGNSETRPEEI
jgi:hypothetical protein